MSEEFKSQLEKLKQDYDLVICDTPPWGLFVDAKIVSQYFDASLYVVGNKISTFKDIILFNKDIEGINKNIDVKYFYNKFDIFFNFLWYSIIIRIILIITTMNIRDIETLKNSFFGVFLINCSRFLLI